VNIFLKHDLNRVEKSRLTQGFGCLGRGVWSILKWC